MGKLFSSYFDWNRGAIPIIHLPNGSQTLQKWLMSIISRRIFAEAAFQPNQGLQAEQDDIEIFSCPIRCKRIA